jgi:hypothetical protein
MLQLLKEISGQKNTLTIPRWLLRITGNDFPAALLANQLIYWMDRLPEENEGWLHKSAADWTDDLSLTTYQVGRATAKLKEIGFPVETRKAKSKYYQYAPVNQYKVDPEALVEFVKIHFKETKKWESKKLETLNTHRVQTETTKDIAFPTETPPARNVSGEEPKSKGNSNVGSGDVFADHNETPHNDDLGLGESLASSQSLADKIASAKSDNQAAPIDPATFTKRDWLLLGGAMWHKHKHFGAIQADSARLDQLVQAGLIRALKRKLKYALTDDGFAWVNEHIPAHYREACVKENEAQQRREKDAAERKAARRLEPPKPKGRQHVYAQIEPLYNAINDCWGGGKLLVPEHNRRVGIARQAHEAQATPAEIKAIYKLGMANDWTPFTPNVILKHLSTVRKNANDNQTKAAAFIKAPEAAPLDPSKGIAFYPNSEQENE